MHEEHGGKDFVVIGINPSDDKAISEQFLRDNGVTFANVIDPGRATMKTVFEEYQTLEGYSAVPLSYVIDRDGKVAAAWYGTDEQDVLTLEKLGIK